MRPEDFAKLEQLRVTFNGTFGVPSMPESAIERVLVAVAALGPVKDVATDPEFTMLTSDWVNPMLADTLERALEVLGELYEQLESEADDTQILEPGTLANQQFTDLPVVGGSVSGLPGPQGVPRGDLIR